MPWFERFTRPWAATGQLAAPTDAQADTGFAFLGINAPTAELFNALFQDSDQKHRWLYQQVAGVMGGAGIGPTQADTAALLRAVQFLADARADQSDASLLAQINALLGRVGTLEGKTGGRHIIVRAYDRRGVFRHDFIPTCKLVIYELVGAGGGGGGGPAPPAGQALVGSGAGSGGYTSGLIVDPLVNAGAFVDVTVGAGGAGQVGNNGLAGGSTGFGGWGVALGGSFGSTFGFATSGIGNSGAGASPGVAVNAVGVASGIRVSGGAPGHTGILLNPTTALGGAGGSGPWGGGGAQVGQNSNGANGTGYGSGGGGCCLLAGQGPTYGGAGSDGHVLVWEYT